MVVVATFAHQAIAASSSSSMLRPSSSSNVTIRRLADNDDGGCRTRAFDDLGDAASQLKAADVFALQPPVFGPDFLWGVATSAYQIEGAFDEDGRGVSIWDTFSKQQGKITGEGNGDVACDHYHKYMEDIQLMQDLGVTHYRFSIAWPRIMPTGQAPVNEAGVAFYTKLVDALLAAGIEPAITLYHWDLPQGLEDQGGWQSAETAAVFGKYADVMFGALGDKVKLWFTLNEPWSVAVLGHGLGVHAPGVQDQRKAVYEAGHNQLLAHAAAAKVYREKYQATQGGKLGIVLSTQFKDALCDSSQADKDAAERNLQFYLGWFAAPIFKGDYPAVMKERAGERLPVFTDAQKEDLKNSVDFLGINTYSSSLVTDRAGGDGGYFDDLATKSSGDPSWPKGDSSWLWIAPAGMRKLLRWVKEEYDSPIIYVTENGVDVQGEEAWEGEKVTKDEVRVNYLNDYISEMGKAMRFDEVDVRGYFVWSLLDNFEWSEGYGSRFGLVRVDYEEDQKRTPKQSFHSYADLIKGFIGDGKQADVEVEVEPTDGRDP